MGRPPIDIGQHRELVQRLCAQGGVTDADIARHIGVSPRTFTKAKERHEWLADLIRAKNRCKPRVHQVVSNVAA